MPDFINALIYFLPYALCFFYPLLLLILLLEALGVYDKKD